MEGYIDENRWIDLSGLPRNSWGIDWKLSVGHVLPFNYNNVKSYIKIEQCETAPNKRPILYITIDKYVPTPRRAHIHQLLYCQIHRLVSNRIADVAPHLIPFLKNPSDAYLYSYQSNKKIWIKCPICGHTEFLAVEKLYLQENKCPTCSDGISYPEKFMMGVFHQLGVDYIKEANKSISGFEWAMLYRYDFAFQFNDDKFILETDGGFHKYQLDIDTKKDILAKNNGFQIIRIDCDYGHNNRYQFIKENIINSPLKNIFDLSGINWDLCNTSATHTMIKDVCSLWETNGLSTKEIRYKTGLSASTIWKYLKYGREIGLCPTYNEKVSHQRGISKKNTQYKMIINNNEVILKEDDAT